MNRKQRRALARHGGAAQHRAAAGARLGDSLAELFTAATAQHRAGALLEAERAYRHILALFPDHAETHGMLGIALVTQGKASEAVSHFERLVALKPSHPGAHDDLGKAYLAAGFPELAVEAAARA